MITRSNPRKLQFASHNYKKKSVAKNFQLLSSFRDTEGLDALKGLSIRKIKYDFSQTAIQWLLYGRHPAHHSHDIHSKKTKKTVQFLISFLKPSKDIGVHLNQKISHLH